MSKNPAATNKNLYNIKTHQDEVKDIIESLYELSSLWYAWEDNTLSLKKRDYYKSAHDKLYEEIDTKLKDIGFDKGMDEISGTYEDMAEFLQTEDIDDTIYEFAR